MRTIAIILSIFFAACAVDDSKIGPSAVVEVRPGTVVEAVSWKGEDPREVTVEVGLVQEKESILATDSGAISANCNRFYGVVEYGTDSYHNIVEFDVGFGTRFTVAGNFVSVSLGTDPSTSLCVGEITKLGVTLGFYAVPLTWPPTRTIVVDTLNAADVIYFNRPIRSVVILPIVCPTDGVSITLWMRTWTGADVGALTYNINEQVVPITIPNDVAQIGITNNGKWPTSFRIPFQLAL